MLKMSHQNVIYNLQLVKYYFINFKEFEYDFRSGLYFDRYVTVSVLFNFFENLQPTVIFFSDIGRIY